MLYSTDDEASLAIRAAWLHYVGGLTQAAVAKRLGVISVKAHRLISRANQEGAVKVIIEGAVATCLTLENELMEAYGLASCTVSPDISEEGLPLRSLGTAGASFLRRELESARTPVIGVGHGRTLSAVVEKLPRQKVAGVKFVSLLGGLTRNYSANPHDVIHRLAEKTGSPAFVMPVPFFANTVEDREVLLAQRGVRDVFELARLSELKFVGIGTTLTGASLVSSGVVERAEIEDVQRKGGVGELLGHFFDPEGALVETALSARTLSIDLESCIPTRIVAVAGGAEKTAAICSVLKSGRLSGLITDERTARALVTLSTSTS